MNNNFRPYNCKFSGSSSILSSRSKSIASHTLYGLSTDYFGKIADARPGDIIIHRSYGVVNNRVKQKIHKLGYQFDLRF